MANIAIESIFGLSPATRSIVNAFGVFVTIYRRGDVHGCVGWWNKNLKLSNNKKIESHLRRVAKSAYFQDHRGGSFAQPAHADIGTEVKVSYMRNPRRVSEEFNSNIHGILRTNGATFLPNVFPNTNTQTIIRKLNEKGGSGGELIMYDTVEQRKC